MGREKERRKEDEMITGGGVGWELRLRWEWIEGEEEGGGEMGERGRGRGGER